MYDGRKNNFRTARRAADALNLGFLPTSQGDWVFQREITEKTSLCVFLLPPLLRPQNNNESAASSSIGSFSPLSLDASFNQAELRAALRSTPYGKAPDRTKSTVRRYDTFRRSVSDSLSAASTTAGQPARFRSSGDEPPSSHS
ncbi:telomerase reverse transcriptase/ribonuclease HI [Trypanosoma cruzi]|nr:telomerase reverse transcriptase/ribonuclease HI [Trypanosoma cruzi]